MYRFILGSDKQYDDKAKNSIAALIAENNQSEQDAIKNYEVLLSCLKDVGATDEQLAVIEEIISDEKNHTVLLNQLIQEYDEIEPKED